MKLNRGSKKKTQLYVVFSATIATGLTNNSAAIGSMSTEPKKLSVWNTEPEEIKPAEGRDAYKKHISSLLPTEADWSENPDKSAVYDYARSYKGGMCCVCYGIQGLNIGCRCWE